MKIVNKIRKRINEWPLVSLWVGLLLVIAGAAIFVSPIETIVAALIGAVAMMGVAWAGALDMDRQERENREVDREVLWDPYDEAEI